MNSHATEQNNPRVAGNGDGPDPSIVHHVELTTNTLQVVRVDQGQVSLARNAALDNKAILDMLLGEAAADWQESGWTATLSTFLPSVSWHLVKEAEVRQLGANATVGALAESLPHGVSGGTVCAACGASAGAPVEAAGESRWLVAVAPSEGMAKLLTHTERCKLRPGITSPGVLDHIGAVSRLLRVTGQESVALWDLSLERSHIFLVTANGVEAIIACDLKLTDVWETIRAELNLKYQLAAARLFYGDLFDFTDAAPRIAGQLAPALSTAIEALPTKGEKPVFAIAGLTPTQSWLASHVAAAIGTTHWQPDAETALAEFGLRTAGDLLPGNIGPALFGLLHRATAYKKGTHAWQPVWNPTNTANFRIALPTPPAPKPVPVVKAPAPAPAPAPAAKPPAPAVENKPAPAPQPAAKAPEPPKPAPAPAAKAPTPAPAPAAKAPTPVEQKPAQPAPAAKAAPAPQPAAKAPEPAKPAPAPAAKAPEQKPAPAPQKPAEQKPAAKAPEPAKPAPAPAPAAKAPEQKPAAKPVEQKPAEQKPAPAPAAKAPEPKVSAPAAAPAAAPAKKSNMGLIIGLAAAVVIGGGVFAYMQHSASVEQARRDQQAAVEKAARDAEADKQRKAAEALERQRQEELAKAKAEADRLRREAEEAARNQANALAAAKAAEERLARAPGVVMVNSDPAGAEVIIDDGTPQVAPAVITNVVPGLRRLTVRAPGYETSTQSISVKGAQTLDVGLVTLQREYGELVLSSNPADSEFAIYSAESPDSNPIRTGRAPARVDRLLPGEYVVKFTRQGLLPTTEHVSIKGTSTIEVSSTFMVGGVSLTTNPAGATVYMNGELLGTTPIIRPDMQPGNARFEITLAGHEPVTLTGKITNSETLRLHSELLNVDRIAKLSEVKTPPQIVSKAQPDLPRDLQDVDAEVVLSVVITRDGTIRDVRVERSNNPAFVDPCLKAITRWKFTPAIGQNGKPVNLRLSIPFRFKKNS